MSVYCGTDIIEVARIKKSMQKSIFKVSIYTDFEIEDIDSASNEDVRYQRYAGRFAAKEAVYKALSPLCKREDYAPSFKDIEIANDESLGGRPFVRPLNDKMVELFSKYDIKLDLSISHVKETAIAICVATVEKEWMEDGRK